MLGLSSRNRTPVLVAIALLVGGAGAAEASSVRRGGPVPAPAMPVGEAAVPPLGFLDLCERSPNLCATADAAAPDLGTLRAAAMRAFWSDAFSRRRSAPAAGVEARFDWSSAFAAARSTPFSQRSAAPRTPVPVKAPVAEAAGAGDAVAAGDAGVTAVETDATAMIADVANTPEDRMAAEAEPSTLIEVAAMDVSPPVAIVLDRAGWKLVNGVNRRINRSIRQTSDARLYGVEDFWDVPHAGRGDCEDFVLAKREALIAAGVAAESLSIAIVETRWGESHAVLLLASDRGEYVLDSLTPWVLRWDRVDYAWKTRQRPGHPFDWVTAAI